MKHHGRSPTHQRLLEIAGDEFLQYGYHGVSMRRLAGIVRLKEASLYHYCLHKADLAHQVLQHTP